ncbi:MAG: glutathione S-transferase family protein [Burkholderiaceae bacterium]
MILYGRFLSPYVRRVATSLNFYGFDYESKPIQHTGEEAATLRKINPIGRVPALVTDSGQVIVESAAILDYLDRLAGPENSLTPMTGDDRTRAINMLGVATGSIDKAISVSYEVRFRPEEKRHQPWVERCEEQARLGYEWLESQLDGQYFLGEAISQVDITTAVGWQYMSIGPKHLHATIKAPKIAALAERLMENPAFKQTFPG